MKTVIFVKKITVPLLALWHCFGFWMAPNTDASSIPSSLVHKIHSRTYPEQGYVGTLVRHIVDTYMSNCNLWIVKGGRNSQVFADVWRALRDAHKVSGLFDLSKTNGQNEVPFQRLGSLEKKETCRAFVCDLTGSETPNVVTDFLDRINLFLIPNAFVIFLGPKPFLDGTLKDRSIRNTASVLYLMVAHSKGKEESLPQVAIYSRCLFCNGSEPGIEFVTLWDANTGSWRNASMFKDQFRDMEGHKMRIVQMSWFPLVDYTRGRDESSNVVTPADSVHVRMLRAVAGALNFTYEMRVPWDCQWGISTESGNWTGMVGTLQHHKADLALSVTYNWERMKVVDYSRIVLKEPIIMVTSKARPTPQYMAIIKPLAGELWIVLSILSVTSGLVLWGLQLAWQRVSGRRGMTYAISCLYTWSILFEEPAWKLPNNSSSLVYLTSWFIFCTLMTAAYKSSLIAHLSVPGRVDSIDSFEELLEDGGWTWGYGDNHSNPYETFKTSTSPVIRKIFDGLQIQSHELQIERVLGEKHALIVNEFLFKSFKATLAKIRRGVTPFHYGKLDYLVNGDGWAFRQNAPYFNAIDMKLQELVETGHVKRWLEELVGTSPKEEECDYPECNTDDASADPEELRPETSGQVVLNLNHLQSAFYLLSIGLAISSLAFVGETLYQKAGLLH